MEKIEVPQRFVRDIIDFVTTCKRYAHDDEALQKEFSERAENPRERDCNTPEENEANSYIFRGKSEAYAFIAKELENMLKWHGIKEY